MEPKRLFRSKRDRIIGGVCGGLGNYFNVDPVIIRVVTAALFFAGSIAHDYIAIEFVNPFHLQVFFAKIVMFSL